jgi:hypothetical protein
VCRHDTGYHLPIISDTHYGFSDTKFIGTGRSEALQVSCGHENRGKVNGKQVKDQMTEKGTLRLDPCGEILETMRPAIWAFHHNQYVSTQRNDLPGSKDTLYPDEKQSPEIP